LYGAAGYVGYGVCVCVVCGAGHHAFGHGVLTELGVVVSDYKDEM
jgi:hypothetical protein